MEVGLELRARLADLYCAYDDALNDGALERWPELFTEACLYKVIPRENFEQGFPVALIYCESRDMLVDRVVGVARDRAVRAADRAPDHQRHLPARDRGRRAAPDGELRGVPDDAGPALRAVPVRPLSGPGGRGWRALRFAERLCIYNSTIVPTSLVYPI